jgi:hypothetical protein
MFNLISLLFGNTLSRIAGTGLLMA